MPGQHDFSALTETTGTPVSPEGAAMIYSRYMHARRISMGKRVLEIGCGAGLGLGIIGSDARSVVGGDYDFGLLASGRRHYGLRFSFVQLTAETLPFADAAFDLVLFFEATYYVRMMDRALDEISRVLAPGGGVLFVNANPERPDFISSPFSHHYHTADEFRAALERRGFDVDVRGSYPVEDGKHRSAVFGLARRALETFGLVPRTLRGRALLKRLAFGKLVTLPAELPWAQFATVAEPVPVPAGPVRGHKVIYVQAKRGRA